MRMKRLLILILIISCAPKKVIDSRHLGPQRYCYETETGLIITVKPEMKCPGYNFVNNESKRVLKRLGIPDRRDILTGAFIVFTPSQLICHTNKGPLTVDGCTYGQVAGVYLHGGKITWGPVYAHELVHIIFNRCGLDTNLVDSNPTLLHISRNIYTSFVMSRPWAKKLRKVKSYPGEN